MIPPISQNPPSRLEDPEASRKAAVLFGGGAKKRHRPPPPNRPAACGPDLYRGGGGKMKGKKELRSLSFPRPFFPPPPR